MCSVSILGSEGASLVRFAPREALRQIGSRCALNEPVSAQRVDITLSDGRRILVEGSTGLSAVLALVEGLMP